MSFESKVSHFLYKKLPNHRSNFIDAIAKQIISFNQNDKQAFISSIMSFCKQQSPHRPSQSVNRSTHNIRSIPCCEHKNNKFECSILPRGPRPVNATTVTQGTQTVNHTNRFVNMNSALNTESDDSDYSPSEESEVDDSENESPESNSNTRIDTKSDTKSEIKSDVCRKINFEQPLYFSVEELIEKYNLTKSKGREFFIFCIKLGVFLSKRYRQHFNSSPVKKNKLITTCRGVQESRNVCVYTLNEYHKIKRITR